MVALADDVEGVLSRIAVDHICGERSNNGSIPPGEGVFTHYSPESVRWVVQSGDYTIRVGASSRDIRLEKQVHR